VVGAFGEGQAGPVLPPDSERTKTTGERADEVERVRARDGIGAVMIELLRKLVWQFQRRTREEDLAEELQFHLDEEASQAGISKEEARRELGNVTRVKEETRSAWGWTMVEQAIQDLHYAGRTLRKNPGFTALAACSLALGIGANTAIYSFMDAVLMRQLPVADPSSLALLKWHITGNKTLRKSVIDHVSGNFYYVLKAGTTTEIFPYP